MKKTSGIFVPPYEPGDYMPKEKRLGHMSTRSVIQLAQGSTPEQFSQMCASGLSTVDDLGRDIRGAELYEEFSMYCREEP